jgi:hypothetical protein
MPLLCGRGLPESAQTFKQASPTPPLSYTVRRLNKQAERQMNKWSINGNVIELSDYDYYNQWIGTIISTNYLGGFLGGYFDKHDQNGNILEKHAKYLHENISHVEDGTFRDLLHSFEEEFSEIIALDKEAIATLARVLGLDAPKKTQDYKTLYKKLEKDGHYLSAEGFLSHPAFHELKQRFMKVDGQRAMLKEKLLSYILAMFPDLARSEYLPRR